MTDEAWAFLVCRNRELDYRTVVAPRFICEAGISSLLAKAADGDLTEQGYAIYRQIHNSKVKDLTIVFRIVEATTYDLGYEEHKILKDPFGREIYLVEGIVLKDLISDIVVTHEDIQEAHKQILEPYQNFWNHNTSSFTVPSEPFSLKNSVDLNQILTLKKLEPLLIKMRSFSSEKIYSKKTWQHNSTIKHEYKDFKILPQSFEIDSIALSSDGITVATRHPDHTVTLWDLDKQIKKMTLGNATLPFHSSSVAFSPNGKLVASGYYDNIRNPNAVKVWNSGTGEDFQSCNGHTSKVNSVTFSNDGQILASGDEKGIIRLWNPKTGQELPQSPLCRHLDLVNSVVVSSDKRTLASGDKRGILMLWKLTNGENLRIISAHSLSLNSVAFSPDSKTIISGSDDYTIKLWNVETGELIRTFSGHTGKVTSVTFNPDGKTIASSSVDARVRLWDVNTGEEISTLIGHNGRVNSVIFSVDGTILASGGKDGTIRLWQLQ